MVTMAALAMAILAIIIAIIAMTVSVFALVRASTPLPARSETLQGFNAPATDKTKAA